MRRAGFYLAYGAAVSILFSIALSQFLLGLALITLLISREKLHFPPIKLPLALFFLTTIVSIMLSADPYGGLPQIRKFFVFGIALAVYSTFTTAQQARSLVLIWTGLATLSALAGFVQFFHRYQQAHKENAVNYGFYLDDRITGFASHWMTFGGEQMIVLLMLLALLLFSTERRWKLYGFICLSVIWISIVLGLTRSIFLLGVPAGALYLIWNWKKWVVAVLPLAALVVMVVAPFQVRERVISVIRPHQEFDSNMRRVIMTRTGWEMVKAHPWFGLGPEQVGPQFLQYAPQDIPRPLPKGWYGHLHNIYLQYAAERGIPALLMMLWLIGKVLYDFLFALRGSGLGRDARFVLHGAVATILAILAAGFFEHNLGDSEILTMFLVVISCGYVVLRTPGYFTQPGAQARQQVDSMIGVDRHTADSLLSSFIRTRRGWHT